MDFIPENFKIKMKELLGDELDSFLDCYNEKHNAGVRVNTLKATPERLFPGSAFPSSLTKRVPAERLPRR